MIDWAQIRSQYDFAPDFLNLEHGFFGMPARPVFAAFLQYQREVLAQNSYFLRQAWPLRRERVMQALAHFSGADAGELHITRNLMESLNIVIQGYPFEPGDEVVHATHDYDEVVDTLRMIAPRKGLQLRAIDIPLDPASDEQIVALYEAAITERTRALLVTHLVHRSGQIMPVARISAMARARGVDVFCDAAHSFAHLDYRIPELGADFVGVNLHKWLGAPLGVGMLYIRQPRIRDIAPLFGDTRHDPDNIGKFAHVGTVPPEPIMAVEDALAFHNSIGSAVKEARLRELKEYWLRRAQAMPGFVSTTPSDPKRSCAIASFRIEGEPAAATVARLLKDHQIFTVTRELQGQHVVRVTPHLYTSFEELDHLVRALTRS